MKVQIKGRDNKYEKRMKFDEVMAKNVISVTLHPNYCNITRANSRFWELEKTQKIFSNAFITILEIKFHPLSQTFNSSLHNSMNFSRKIYIVKRSPIYFAKIQKNRKKLDWVANLIDHSSFSNSCAGPRNLTKKVIKYVLWGKQIFLCG